METEIVKRMRDEEADLARKLKAVRDFLAAYGERVSSDATGAAAATAPKQKAATGSREKVGIDGFGEYGRTIIAEAMRALLTTAHPMKTRQVVEFLDAMNVEISGENKINAVGALLSRSNDIISHGKAGWTLADRERATEIVGKYARNENGASNGNATDAPEARGWGVPPPSPHVANPNQWPGA